ncbi:LamG domain-containing protein [Dactylosporangium sp. CA-139066]|uniref:LamG domain-containing protein n=1 Tax=Dactylosporangium sp. CA-139066 TaxID=3239930 RepID=UPI003D918333
MSGVPPLADVAGEWMAAADLAHLPSLRNQVGQAHVNHDLTSLSWLAAPPYTFGYHTGVLRLDGHVPPAQRLLWKPWGVTRVHSGSAVTVVSDTRMTPAADEVLWRVRLTNHSAQPVTCRVEQELYAAVAHTETGWGWLYDVPWTAGNHHDFMTLERIRATTRGGAPAHYLLGPGRRVLRLGRPRPPGIQRDADTDIMDLSHELPRHVSPDTVYPHTRSATATLRIRGEHTLRPETELALDAFELRPGDVLAFDVRPEAPDDTGILLTHGNHPDSLQAGLDRGRLWFGIAGEQEYATTPLTVGAWHRVELAVHADHAQLRVDGRPAARTRHWTRSTRWKPVWDGAHVTIADTRSEARAAYAFAAPPDTAEEYGCGARASWHVTLPPGASRTIGFVCAYGIDDAVTVRSAKLAESFDAAFAAVESGWNALWHKMFTPGNDAFSGHLPTLHAEDPGVGRAYYMAALLALYMRNMRASAEAPVFLTGGPRLGATTTYFWDHTEWSRLYAMLDPAGLRTWLLRALSTPYGDCFGFDTRSGGPLGNAYVATDYSLFRLIEHYVAVTGDTAFLSETAGARTVLEHVRALAYGWSSRTTEATGGVLADLGPDPWRLLECVPGYVHAVASFNAAYVGMLRAYARLLHSRGDTPGASAAESDASRLAEAVLALATADGRWRIRRPSGDDVIGHCLDFGLTAAYLHADLPREQRAAMVAFVESKLLAGPWMRALALDDPAAPTANRPDHGAAGAFGAWPGVTAYGLARLGRRDLAARLLAATPAAASGALWGQAQEIVTPTAAAPPALGGIADSALGGVTDSPSAGADGAAALGGVTGSAVGGIAAPAVGGVTAPDVGGVAAPAVGGVTASAVGGIADPAGIAPAAGIATPGDAIRTVGARVAEAGVSNRDAIAGVGIAEAIIAGLFGIEPTFGQPHPRSTTESSTPPDSQPPATVVSESTLTTNAGRTWHVPGIGTLSNVNMPGQPG